MALLASCSQENRHICVPVPSIADDATAGVDSDGLRIKLAGCLNRWATRLAPAPGANQEIGRAVVAGCEDGLEALDVRLAVEAAKAGATFDETRGNETIRRDRAYAEAKALFYVVAARAGRCPPA